MNDVDWRYASEKLGDAVRILMIPHGPEPEAFASAMHEFELAFRDVSETGDEQVDRWIGRVRRIWERAEGSRIPEEDKAELSKTLWELSGHADREMWST